MPCAAKWKDLEVIMLSEVSQKKTHVICCHLNVESKEMLQVNLFTKQKQVHRYSKQTYGYQRGKAWEEYTENFRLTDTYYYT